MPPKPKETADDAVLPLQDWLKLLASHGVTMRVAMALAAKMYKTHNTKAKLAAIKPGTLPDTLSKEDIKVVKAALKQVASGQGAKLKKGGRDADLLRPPPDSDPRAPNNLPTTFEFHEILNTDDLLPVVVTVNRAPIKTAWCYAVARRIGFDVHEALSIAHTYVHISSMKHALSLGNILDAEQTREAEDEIRELPGEQDYRRPDKESERDKWKRRGKKDDDKGVFIGSSQPWVGILKANPVIERPDGTWRALQKGATVEPSVAYLYITRALKDFTPHVMGAMQLVANSYPPAELEIVGLTLYNHFKPDVVEWGKRGRLEVAQILDQVKGPVEPVVEDDEAKEEAKEGAKKEAKEEAKADGDGKRKMADATDDPPSKKARTDMSLEEYEAMLDAEDDNLALLDLP